MEYDIGSIVSYKIKEISNKEIQIEKNNEKINLTFKNIKSYQNFRKNVYLQNKYGVLNEPTSQLVLNEMDERNCNWVILDNNLNFIQCFDDKTYYPICKDTRQKFSRDHESWSVGIMDGLKVKLIPIENNYFDFKNQKDELYKYEIYILNLDKVVYIKEKPLVKYPSQLLYLFHKSQNNSLYLHTTFNKSWLYD